MMTVTGFRPTVEPANPKLTERWVRVLIQRIGENDQQAAREALDAIRSVAGDEYAKQIRHHFNQTAPAFTL
jgi:hypothetical protein